ncbi:MAG: fumarate hydratase C-terminal domain-containing protein, partial [Endomicrobia bacterium]|nr:fumarate hydratase C-terminal domain-containing protein [Endomicrobiia bacterium]
NEHKINLPLVSEDLLYPLMVGDKVYLSGEILVFRDQVHKKIASGNFQQIENVNFYNSGIYYCAATPPKGKFVIGSCGPTSAYRMDNYTEPLLKLGVKIMVGKGYRNKTIAELCKQYKAVYLITYGGCGALLNKYVKFVEIVAFSELGTEAMYKFFILDFPSIVAINTRGETIW